MHWTDFGREPAQHGERVALEDYILVKRNRAGPPHGLPLQTPLPTAAACSGRELRDDWQSPEHVLFHPVPSSRLIRRTRMTTMSGNRDSPDRIRPDRIRPDRISPDRSRPAEPEAPQIDHPKKPFRTPGKNTTHPAPEIGTDGQHPWPLQEEPVKK